SGWRTRAEGITSCAKGVRRREIRQPAKGIEPAGAVERLESAVERLKPRRFEHFGHLALANFALGPGRIIARRLKLLSARQALQLGAHNQIPLYPAPPRRANLQRTSPFGSVIVASC